VPLPVELTIGVRSPRRGIDHIRRLRAGRCGVARRRGGPRPGKKDAEGNPVRELHLVFPTGNGNVESRGNYLTGVLWPAMIAAGVTVPKLGGKPVIGEDDEAVMKAKYAGAPFLRIVVHQS
jgi:hypothetical protein